MTATRVLLADDHALIRAGIRALLEKVKHLEVVGEAGDGNQTLELIKQLQPDVVLLDLSMPGASGFEVLQRVTENFPSVRVIVLTAHEGDQYALQTMRLGAAGYLPKSAASAELELAINQVMAGKNYLSKTREQHVSRSSKQRSISQPDTAELTPRQREVLTLIAEGNSTKDIARALSISVKTVETHRAQLMDRLNIHDIAGLVRYAIKTGMISIDHGSPAKKTRNKH